MSTAHEAFGVAAEPLAFDVMRGIWQRNRTRIESTTTTCPLSGSNAVPGHAAWALTRGKKRHDET